MSVEGGRAKGVEGAVGVAPPADAPQESAQPITPDAEATMRARAAANERQLAPFKPATSAAPKPATPAAAPVSRTLRRANRPAVPTTTGIILTDTDYPSLAAPTAEDVTVTGQGAIDQIEDVPPTDPTIDALPPLTDDDRARMPAASMTDTPARGAPKVLPGQQPLDKQITGGFSDALDAQYFPLDGTELCQLVLGLFDQLATQIPNDLRFSMALTYPRVRVRVRVEVEGHAEDSDAGFVIEKVSQPKEGQKGGTVLEIARSRATEMVFVVQALRQEFDAEGQSDTPPDALRDELQLTKPQKQLLTDGNGRQTIVDRLPTDLASLTR